jgi:hypothetical protein
MRADRLGHELLDRAPPEHLAGHCGRSDHQALLLGEPVQTRTEQRVDRLGDADVAEIRGRHPTALLSPEEAIVVEHAQHLLEEEGVAACRLRDAVERPLVQLRATEQFGHQAFALAIVERAER